MATRSPDGRAAIKAAAQGGFEAWVSFGTDPATGKRLREYVRGRTKSDVAAQVKDLEAKRDSGYRPVNNRETLLAWFDVWAAGKQVAVAEKTYRGYMTDRRHLVTSGVGEVRMSRLRVEDVSKLYRHILDSGCSGGTVLHVRRTLSPCLKAAVHVGRLARNPLPYADVPRHRARNIAPLSEDEALSVLDAALADRNAARWYLALLVGPRQGECLALKWDDLDLQSGTAHIHQSLYRGRWKHGCDDPETCLVGTGAGRHVAKRGADCPQRFGGGLLLGPT
jgi:integrase